MVHQLEANAALFADYPHCLVSALVALNAAGVLFRLPVDHSTSLAAAKVAPTVSLTVFLFMLSKLLYP
jgi:hypothetical protein